MSSVEPLGGCWAPDTLKVGTDLAFAGARAAARQLVKPLSPGPQQQTPTAKTYVRRHFAEAEDMRTAAELPGNTRAELYAEILTTCASCHERAGVAPNP